MMFTRMILMLSVLTCCIRAGSSAQELDLPAEPVHFLALGDSYTIGHGVTVEERWPEQFRDSLEARGVLFDTLHIRAVTGWTTADLLEGIEGRGYGQSGFNLVSLLIGVNNQFQGKPESLYVAEFRELLDSAILYAGNRPDRVMVVSIPDYGVTPFGSNWPNTSGEIDRYNAINDSIARALNVPYFNITPISRSGEEGLLAGDQLHPSGYQYGLWVSHMLGQIPLPPVLSSAASAAGKQAGLYPNPASKRVYVSAGQSTGPTPCFITDIHGRLWMTLADISLSGNIIDIPSGWPPGVYYLHLPAMHEMLPILLVR